MINYVLQETKEQKLTYVGYSQGSVMGFAGFSTQPELAAKVKLFIALAPVARVSHIEGAVSVIAKFYREIDVCSYTHYSLSTLLSFIQFLFKVLGVRDFLPSDAFTRFIASEVCPLPAIDRVCENVLFLIVGFDEQHLNMVHIS